MPNTKENLEEKTSFHMASRTWRNSAMMHKASFLVRGVGKRFQEPNKFQKSGGYGTAKLCRRGEGIQSMA